MKIDKLNIHIIKIDNELGNTCSSSSRLKTWREGSSTFEAKKRDIRRKRFLKKWLIDVLYTYRCLEPWEQGHCYELTQVAGPTTATKLRRLSCCASQTSTNRKNENKITQENNYRNYLIFLRRRCSRLRQKPFLQKRKILGLGRGALLLVYTMSTKTENTWPW